MLDSFVPFGRPVVVGGTPYKSGMVAGDLRVPDDREAEFLAPHPMRIIPGAGEVMERDLLNMGIPLIGSGQYRRTGFHPVTIETVYTMTRETEGGVEQYPLFLLTGKAG